ncbi:hypothetical protein M5689_009002 [Euphorbia peplus]|nr:hypothetical protein M5689_009002 [Euphorbia peplus]
MVSGMQRRLALRRKLRILRTLTSSKSVKRSCIIADAVLYIYKLKLHLDRIKTELSNFDAIKTQHFGVVQKIHFPKKEVNVEKSGKEIVVKVKCEKGENNHLVGILEAFEEMGLMVLNARVSRDFCFEMDAIVVPQNSENYVDLKIVSQAILHAIEGN